MLSIQVGKSGRFIDWWRIGVGAVECRSKLRISSIWWILRPFFGVWCGRRLLWCIQAYHESPITYTSWNERFQYRLVLYWRCYIRNTAQDCAFPVFGEFLGHFSVFGVNPECYGAYKRIMSRLLYIQVGTNGSSIGWCCIGDATYETLWKLALSPGLRRARLFLGVWSRRRPLWCIHTYPQSPTTDIR